MSQKIAAFFCILTVCVLPLWGGDLFYPEMFGAYPNDGKDDSKAIQAAIDAASKKYDATVLFSSGKYLINETLRMSSNYEHCRLEGSGYVVLSYTGKEGAPLLHIGNNSTHGVLKTFVKNLTFHGNRKKGTTGILLEHAAYTIVEGCNISFFETGFYNKGSIGTILDGQNRIISYCDTGILIESSKSIDPVPILRFASNLVHITNYQIKAGKNGYGIRMRNGSNADQTGSGGNVVINRCLFEHAEGGSTSVDISNSFETAAGFIRNNIKIVDNWFESYGDIGISVTNSQAIIENNFFVGGGTYYIYVTGELSKIYGTNNSNYGLDTHPVNNYFFYFDPDGIPLSQARKSVIMNNAVDCPQTNLESLQISYPKVYKHVTSGYNWDVSFDLKELIAQEDIYRGYVDIVIMGYDGVTSHQVSLRMYIQHSLADEKSRFYRAIVLDSDDVNTFELKDSVITLKNDGTGGWFGAVFTFTHY